MSACLGVDPSPEAFGSWAKKRGVFLHPDVAFLVPTKTMGTGVFARRPLPRETVIVSCPFKSSISPYAEPSAVDAPCVKSLNDAKIGDNVLYVTLRLMAEVLRPSSPWLPWLKACPRMRDHFFDSEIVGEMFSSAVNTLPGTVSTKWTNLSQQTTVMSVSERWATAVELMRSYPEHWPPERATLSLFYECLALVLSRNFHRENIEGREGPYLLPGLDMVNHSFDANTTLEIRGGGRKHPLTFCLVSKRELRRGEQVLFSYGRIGAARYAVEFQFVTDSVIAKDMLHFSVDVIVDIVASITASSEGTKSTEENIMSLRWRAERLQRLGFLFDEGFYVSRLPPPLVCGEHEGDSGSEDGFTRSGTLPPAIAKEMQRLLNVFHLMTVDADEFNHLIHKINRDWEVERVSSVLTVVSKAIVMRLEAARVQLNLAQERFVGEELSSRRRLAVAVLSSELNMLNMLQEHIKGMH